MTKSVSAICCCVFTVVAIDECPVQIAFAGDNAVVTITGTDMNNIGVGSILCDPADPIKAASRFRARVVIFNIDIPITKGFPVSDVFVSVPCSRC